jgi:hypothetical protein
VLFRNTAAATVALVTGYVFSFIVAPIMLWRLGLAQFGVWAVTGAFATYAGLMDLGITRGLGRFIAFYHARGDRRAVEQLFTLGLIASDACSSWPGRRPSSQRRRSPEPSTMCSPRARCASCCSPRSASPCSTRAAR